MQPDPLTLSLETLIAASPMLGHNLEDRSRIRNAQDPALAEAIQKASTVPLSNPAQRELFLVAPLDILVVEQDGQKQFHITEANGTGIGGLTNVPTDVMATVLTNLTEFAHHLAEPSALVLVAVSGIESSRKPRRNHLVHEKLLYAEALKRGFDLEGSPAVVLTMAHLEENPEAIRTGRPTVVLGYIKEFLNHLELDHDGQLFLLGRPVTAAINDRFCLNVLNRFAYQVDLTQFATLNRCFMVGGDKALAYSLLNEYAASHPARHFPDRIEFDRAGNRTELISGVLDWLRHGRKVVIKAQGTGLGHGIEFFLDPHEPLTDILGKVDHSIRLTEHYYGAVGGAFPYTLCEFIDTCAISRPDHPLSGHKYELRVVVYRDGMSLKALPSITKISSLGYDADRPSRLSLINNITASAEARKREGTDFMLPLCNPETLALLHIEPAQLLELSAYCTGFVRHILDRLQEQPERFGLPGPRWSLFSSHWFVQKRQGDKETRRQNRERLSLLITDH